MVIIREDELRQELEEISSSLATLGRKHYKPNRKQQMWLLIAEYLVPDLLTEYFPGWEFRPGDSCIVLVKQ